MQVQVKPVSIKRITVFQQANGAWRWRALGNNNKRLGNAGESYTNFPDCVSNMVGVTDAIKRKIKVVVTKKDGTMQQLQ